MSNPYDQNYYNSGTSDPAQNQTQTFFCNCCGATLSQWQRFCNVCGADVSQVNPYLNQGTPSVNDAPQQQYGYNQPQTQYPNTQSYDNQYAYNSQGYDNQYSYNNQGYDDQYAYNNNQSYDNQYAYNNAQSFDNQYAYNGTQNYYQAPQPQKKMSKPQLFKILGNAASLLLAVIMVISLFVPLFSVEVNLADFGYDKEKVNVGFNTIDALTHSVNLFLEFDEDDIEDEWEDLIDYSDKYEDDWEDGKSTAQFVTYLKKSYSLELKRIDPYFSVNYVMTFIFSLAHIIIALITVILALIRFISCFKKDIKPINNTVFGLLCIDAVVLIANAYCFNRVISGSDEDISITAQIVLYAIILSVMAGLFVIKMLNKPFKVRTGEIIKRSLTVTMAIIILISVFSPVVSTKIKGEFRGEDDESSVESPLDSKLFGRFELTEDEKEYYEELFEEDSARYSQFAFYSFVSSFTKKEVKKADQQVQLQNAEVYSVIAFSGGTYEFSEFFALGILAFIMVVALTLLILFMNIREFITRKRTPSAIMVLAKTFLIVMSALVAILAIVMTVVVNFNADFAEIKYQSNIAYGPILMLIGTIGIACIPAVSRKELAEIE